MKNITNCYNKSSSTRAFGQVSPSVRAFNASGCTDDFPKALKTFDRLRGFCRSSCVLDTVTELDLVCRCVSDLLAKCTV